MMMQPLAILSTNEITLKAVAPLSVRSSVIRSAAMVWTVGSSKLLPSPSTATAANV